MNIRVWSIRTIFAIVITMMGLLGMILALVSGVMHSDLAIENQRQAIIELINIKSTDLIKELIGHSTELGLSLQHESVFIDSYKAKNKPALEKMVNNQFYQYFVTAGVIDLVQLVVIDGNYEPIFTSKISRSKNENQSYYCATLLSSAKRRTGAERLKIKSQLCLNNGRPYLSVLVPIGGLRPIGYLVVVTDPVLNLTRIESLLGMPLKLATMAGDVIFTSNKWPVENKITNMFQAVYLLKTNVGRSALKITVISRYARLNQDLNNTRLLVMLVAGVSTLLMALIVMWVLRETTLTPLAKLTQQLQMMKNDKLNIGKTISVGGSKEISVLMHDFNDMTTRMKNLYATLENMAFVDPLTKLPNRNWFHEQLYELAMDPGNVQQFALLLMDLDRFKCVNDALGHYVGDRLLTKVAERLQQALYLSDIKTQYGDQNSVVVDIARLGGDEFATLIPVNGDSQPIKFFAQRLLNVMKEPFVIDSYQFIIGLSIGISLYPKQGFDGTNLLRRADIAMYHAKRTKCGFAFYESNHEHGSLYQLALERDLSSAIDNNEFMLVYQPKYLLKSAEVYGTEALIRWNHPKYGIIPPDEFIPLAEQTGFIQSIADWVLDEALQACSQWQKDGFPIGVSINLSAVNLHGRRITKTISQLLKKWNLTPSDLTLEITESAVMSDPNFAIEMLTELDAMGVSLSIDDFGTGYSSLSLVKQLPVDEIKVDKSFVREMTVNKSDEAIVRSVIVLAQHMGLIVVAEGVEDKKPWDRLIELGCDAIQGYYLAKPMSIDSYRDWLKSSHHLPIHTQSNTPRRMI